MTHKVFHFLNAVNFPWTFEKEEAWLNRMSSRGWQLVKPGFFRYTFEDGTPGDYQYRIEFTDINLKSDKGTPYLSLLEESGIELVAICHVRGSENNIKAQYSKDKGLEFVEGAAYPYPAFFRRKTAAGSFVLFNDIDSTLKHLKRVYNQLAVSIPIFFAIFASQFFTYFRRWNWVLSILALLLLVLLAFQLNGIVRLRQKCRNLKRERQIRE
jgi:hypothetical protein